MNDSAMPSADFDPYRFLENFDDEALAWAQERTTDSLWLFSGKRFDRHLREANEILSAKDKLVVGSLKGDYVYHFMVDGAHPRGAWRRCTQEAYDSYRNEATEPHWEYLLDIATQGDEDGTSWVFGGALLRRPDYDRALITLSPGGSDACVIREFDLASRSFISPQEGGFEKPLGKGQMRWVDADTVLLTHDFGEGSMSESGYPISVRRWTRGQQLEQSQEVFRGEPSDMMASFQNFNTPGAEKTLILRALSMRTTEVFDLNRTSLELSSLHVPTSAMVSVVRQWLVLQLRQDWDLAGTHYERGSLLLLPYADALTAPDPNRVQVLYRPGAGSSLQKFAATASGIMFSTLENVHTHLFFAQETAGSWQVQELHPHTGAYNNIAFNPVDPDTSDEVDLTVNGFITPTTLFRGSFRAGTGTSHFEVKKLRSAPARFDTTGLEVRQRWAVSADGTKIPYFVVGQTAALDGQKPAPTLLSAYGGFQVSKTPFYLALYGKGLLEKGYVYVLANIRGGGEFGPGWHQAALKENRHKSFEDFAAVAGELVDSGVTTVPQLAAMGGSNGGLLMGNMYTRYPHLFGAIVCMVPLLDMKRYSQLLAGASWKSEYGDPDTADWEYIQTFSPYHNVNPADVHPTLLLTTSTRDDRVHPGHARKFMALVESLGKPVHYFENSEGGHAGAADIKQSAYMYAMIFTYLDNAILP